MKSLLTVLSLVFCATGHAGVPMTSFDDFVREDDQRKAILASPALKSIVAAIESTRQGLKCAAPSRGDLKVKAVPGGLDYIELSVDCEPSTNASLYPVRIDLKGSWDAGLLIDKVEVSYSGT
jgi:hypothetical protein